MTLVIQTTGLEQYAPGGEARLKLLIIGGPGAGKTRFASFFPRPIYADCEAGLASVADRNVPYVGVNTSADMLDLLTHLKQECRLPKDKRTYDTVVIDTLDAYQRKLKNEWMEKEKKEAFTGWEAWGFVAQRLQLLLTRLLNLDMNVVVNVHYKDKTTRDDDTGKETHELMLQLQGEIADTAFNDFDLVGWMGTYWEAVAGERTQKRGLTFRATPDKPFLKDRLFATPPWMEIGFSDQDYANLFSHVTQRLESLKPSQVVGEVPSADLDDVPGVARPENATSGPLPPRQATELPLTQLDKPAVIKRVRDLGLTTLPDGSPIRGNTTKGELIAAIEHHLQAPATPAAPEPTAAPAPQPDTTTVANPARITVPAQKSAPDIERVSEGLVNTTTGELLTTTPPTVEQAVATVADQLGGQVIEQPEPPKPTPVAAEAVARQKVASAEGNVCEECGTDLAGEIQDYVKLAWIKYRKKLCAADYQARKQG